jgi:heat shock protein HslJ
MPPSWPRPWIDSAARPEPAGDRRRQPAMSSRKKSLAAIALFVTLAGCVGGANSPNPRPRADPPPSAADVVEATGSWQMSSGTVDGVGFRIVPDAPITMTVKGSDVGGRSACNHYGAEFVVEDGEVRLRMSSMTMMACPEPAMSAETAFVGAIGRVTGATRDGDRLTLTGPGVELVFDRLAPVPVAALVGTDWVLESLISGDAVSSVAGDPATLRLEADGTFNGSTGCRTFKGRWIEADGGITPTDLAMDGECPADLASQDGHVVSVLEGFRVAIDGDVLTLTGGAGQGLGYRVVRSN